MKKIYKKVAQSLNLPEKAVREAYMFYWKVVKEAIEALPFKEELTEEEFNSLKTSFNLPSLGKLYCSYDKFVKHKKHLKYLEKTYVKDKESKTIA